MSHDAKVRGLVGQRLKPLPLGTIKPSGWMRDQLRAQADGLTGHLDEFWSDVAESAWIGGNAEGWERGPYWLDGLIPLAFLLDDNRLKVKAKRWIDAILFSQRENGWIGPEVDEEYGYDYDPWPLFVVFKALIQYHEATSDERIPEAIEKCLLFVNQILDTRRLRSWARYRWADLIVAVNWLYERTEKEWLLSLGRKLHDQGFDWRGQFERFSHRYKSRREECDLSTHVVNNAMAIKTPAVWYRQSHDPRDFESVRSIISVLDTFHGQANGSFSGDEHLAGKSPAQGTELCAVVEYMYSLEEAIAVTGDPILGDRLEQLAFNALPATISPDMWSHQYDQQVNQVVCKVNRDRVWTSNGPESNIFGLAPNYGCCTANMHQGWPKLVSHLWMRNEAGGLSAIAYAPSTVETEVNGSPVRIALETSYPFGEVLKFTVVVTEKSRFPIDLRIPEWADWAEVAVDGTKMWAPSGKFFRVEREWHGTTVLTLFIPAAIRLQRRFNGSVSVFSGALLYGLQISEKWNEYRGEAPHNDWELSAASDWNYALEIDARKPQGSFDLIEENRSGSPFVSGNSPVKYTVRGRKLPSWAIEHGSASAPPASPLKSEQPLENLVLVPYGCTNLRIAEFPVLERT